MKDLLAAIAHNYVCLREEAGKLRFQRFTDRQMDYYAQPTFGMDLYPRTVGPSSVTLDFETDAPWLRMVYDCVQLVPRWTHASFDLWVDGVLVSSTPCEEGQDRVYSVTFPGRRMRHVQLYFPFSRKLLLSALEIGPGQILPVHYPELTLFCGDSITMGNLTAYSSMQYTNILARQRQQEILNQGVGGFFFDADSLDGDLPRKPDTLVLAYGTNDFGRLNGDTDLLEANMHRYLQRLFTLFPGTRTYALTPTWRLDRSQEDRDRWTEAMEAVFSQYSEICTVPGEALVPHVPGFYADGRLHPNDLGNQMLAQGLLRRMV